MKIKNQHDFFKETMGNVETAKDFLENYLSEPVIQDVNLDTLNPQKGSFISPELKENFFDLLFEVDISGKEGYLYFLFEHKRYPDKGLALKLLKNMAEIWEAKMNNEYEKASPIIIPLVIYHDQIERNYPEGSEVTMTIAQTWMEEGMKKGLE